MLAVPMGYTFARCYCWGKLSKEHVASALFLTRGPCTNLCMAGGRGLGRLAGRPHLRLGWEGLIGAVVYVKAMVIPIVLVVLACWSLGFYISR